MSGTTQLVAAYEADRNISFDDLCSAFPQYEPEAIKMVLVANSSRYRAELKKDNVKLFNEQERDLAKLTMVGLMSDERHAFRAAQYILDDYQGRHDVKAIQNVNIKNVISIDQRMKRAKEALERVEEKNKVIDIEPVPATAA